MLDSVYGALLKAMKIVKVDVAKSLRDKGRFATGKTERSLRVTVEESDKGFIGTLYGAKHIQVLEPGRKPTKATSGNPSEMLRALKEWADAKGILIPVYAIYKKIHREGYKGKPGAVTDGLAGKSELIKREINLASRLAIQAEVLKALK